MWSKDEIKWIGKQTWGFEMNEHNTKNKNKKNNKKKGRKKERRHKLSLIPNKFITDKYWENYRWNLKLYSRNNASL